MKRILSILGLALLAMNVWAQQALFSGNDIVSPEVHPDGTVTFRLYAPKAVKVELTGDFLPQVKVQSPMGVVEQPGYVTLKEEKGGLWTYTSEKLADELYSYKFRVDGMDYLDPSNVYMCRDIASYTNIFIVTREKGDKGDLYSVNEVPHGNVSKVWYDSPTLQTKRRMTVYTPAGYEKGGRYPVLYLLHGAGGDEDAWTTLGRAAQIMDNL
ncbi:MAG: alpha/beta hydrolase-fold protein, partial [Parabacteroides sp.]|nr:alpha/beta hydrolase-fold protein [Parabacteroides sp.]